MLEGTAEIEKSAYEKLCELGAPKLISIRSVGGGSKNIPWSKIRSNILKTKMIKVEQTETAYGSAKLALRGVIHSTRK